MTDPWERYAKSYPIHEESRTFTNFISTNGLKPLHQYSLHDSRKTWSQAIKAAAGEVTFDGTVQELAIPSPYSADGIAVSVYKPKSSGVKPAIVVYFHGGGLSILNKTVFEPTLKLLATQAGCIIVNVEYRLIPDQGEPLAPFNDGITATTWVLKNKETVGGHAESKVGVAGDSAGGQISASVSADLSGLEFQILIYANVDMALNIPSVEEFTDVPGLSKLDIWWFRDIIKQAIPDYLTNPRVNLMARTNVGHSPPTLILQADMDSIRDSGLVYAEKLKAGGVKVKSVMVEGVPHCFFLIPAIFKTKCQEAYGHIADFLKDFQ